MKSSELIEKLLPTSMIAIDNPTDGDDEVFVEIEDTIYLPIKEIYFVANPNRTIIRLGNGEKE
jgi:hypothetical protein